MGPGAAVANAAAGNAEPSSSVRRVLLNPLVVVGLTILSAIGALALLAPLLTPGDPLSIAGPARLWPGEIAAFPLGTDALGRNVLAGVLHGARASIFVGLSATLLGVVIGILIGAVAGYFGGWVDDLIVRFIEIFQTIPSFVLLVVLVAFSGPSLLTVILGIALVSWDVIARLTRSEFRRLSAQDFVSAARVVGYDHSHIIRHEILPNAAPALIVTGSIMVASALLMEAALSFMGLGDPNLVSWGSMIGSGRELLRTHWYLTAIPGGFIVVSVLALNLLGDGLNDVLNPRHGAAGQIS
ncbi:ABC transporter permease [Devosia epidermidihirudinis]|uniref:ABC transporter permease n=1 Tax=Devosia epidermidihirudinis TaxID=1293439 RepID=A0A0F5QC44_9HYPH|nr:ABC transporter permease [Devosia epidermidihirudinis]